MRLSVLDQSVAVAGRPQGVSIRETVEMAQYCEGLGYHRYWVSEHHNHDTITGSAPEIVMAAIAATTTRIRIGSAGIMLPHYAALKVAEQFRVLDALAPGRIDLGLGRAPGSDGRSCPIRGRVRSDQGFQGRVCTPGDPGRFVQDGDSSSPARLRGEDRGFWRGTGPISLLRRPRVVLLGDLRQG